MNRLTYFAFYSKTELLFGIHDYSKVNEIHFTSNVDLSRFLCANNLSSDDHVLQF